MSESELKLVGFAIDKEHGIIIQESLLINRPLTKVTIFFGPSLMIVLKRGQLKGRKFFPPDSASSRIYKPG
jgi:hypothetical protein